MMLCSCSALACQGFNHASYSIENSFGFGFAFLVFVKFAIKNVMEGYELRNHHQFK